MAVIKDGNITGNDWRHAADDEALPEGNATVSLKRWLAEQDSLAGRPAPLGLRLTAADAIEGILGDLGRFGVIVFDMAHFTDGRVFSQARLLRERHGYAGELRARGDFLRDQMFFLHRVGVNAFEFPEGADLENMLHAFREFSVTYQTGADEPLPLHRRRG
ncbi:DUF934 domain-containing protein [Methylomagnum sp.]